MILVITMALSFECLGSLEVVTTQSLPSDQDDHLLSSSLFNQLNHFEKRDTGSIMAGASSRPITPDLSIHSPIYIAGFERNRVATGIHDDIWSRTCCLQIGNTTIAFVSVDLIGVMYPEYQRIIQQLPETVDIDLVVLTSTHNHQGPDVIGLWGHSIRSGITWDWYDQAIDIMAETIIEAYENMQPAGILLAHSVAENMSRDSREPIIMEEQVETLQVIDLEEQVIATLVFYASHPEILWNKNTLITSDYPHYLYEYIEKTVGGTALLLMGPIGGLITPNTRDHTFEGAKHFGEAIANISLSSLKQSEPIWETDIRVISKELFIPLRNPIFRIASILNVLQRPLYNLRRDLLTSVNVIELGYNATLAQIVTVPGEDFPENWFELKEKMHAQHRIHIGLANDELGYIIPRNDYDIRKYEESMSASKYLEPIIYQALEEMVTFI